MVNSVNLTDGIDGLASSVTLVIGAFFAIWAFSVRSEQLSMIAAVLMGAALGFLIYNFHPARVFMGDTGSLFFGALVIGAAFMMKNPIVGLAASAVFVIEMLSSLLQRLYFRATHGKRIFKMAPLHHHFEKCGWSERAIMVRFSIAAALFCLLGWFLL
jgi:phospho-N-acetylmuramoyl-pentapeptide-transferase